MQEIIEIEITAYIGRNPTIGEFKNEHKFQIFTSREKVSVELDRFVKLLKKKYPIDKEEKEVETAPREHN